MKKDTRRGNGKAELPDPKLAITIYDNFMSILSTKMSHCVFPINNVIITLTWLRLIWPSKEVTSLRLLLHSNAHNILQGRTDLIQLLPGGMVLKLHAAH